jgi:hypothetical protein
MFNLHRSNKRHAILVYPEYSLWGFLFFIVVFSVYCALKMGTGFAPLFVARLFLANYKYFDRLFLVGGLT